MSKTTQLRGLIRGRLQALQGETYHRTAHATATYPYKVYSLASVSFYDADRDDFELTVDLWDRAKDYKNIESLADQVEQLFNAEHLPQPPLYPTFFREGRYTLDDPDKTLQHIQLRFSVQLYETKED